MESNSEIERLIEHLKEKGLNRSREEIKALLEKRRKHLRLYQTGNQYYDESKFKCANCNGQHTVQGEYWADGKLHEDKACIVIIMPLLKRILQKPEELDQKVKDLCPHAGAIREFQGLDKGYIPGPYATCQRPEESESE